jgi:cytochrome c551/c552
MSRLFVRPSATKSVPAALAAGAGLFLLAGGPAFAGDVMDVTLPGGISPVTLLALVGGGASVAFLLLVGLIDQLKEGGCPEGLKRVLGAIGAGGLLATAVLFAVTWPGQGYPEPDYDKTWAPDLQQARLDTLGEMGDYGATGEEGKFHVPVDRAMEQLVRDASLLKGQALQGPSWETMTPAERGKAIFEGLAGSRTAAVSGYAACKVCHSIDGSRIVGPSLAGRWGKEAATTTGPVTFDRAYLKESVQEPMARIADTFPPAMPAQAMPDELIDALAAYLQGL